MMLWCVLVFVEFYFANSEWVEISPIAIDKNMSGSWTTPNYENIITTPILNDHFILTTPLYDLGQTNFALTKRPSIVNMDTHKYIRRRQGVDINTKKTTVPTLDGNDENVTEKSDGNQGFFSVLRMVQNKLMSYKTTTHQSKVSVLKNLRDTLLVNIHERISKLWIPKGSREARGYKDEEDEHHMEFPSNEGALMTIGFLTFAVFLIKLVIKLVQALKYKHEYYRTTTTTTTAASIIFLNRKKRDDVLEDSAKIMQYIDEYPTTFLGDS